MILFATVRPVIIESGTIFRKILIRHVHIQFFLHILQIKHKFRTKFENISLAWAVGAVIKLQGHHSGGVVGR